MELDFANRRALRWSGKLEIHAEEFRKGAHGLHSLDKEVVKNRYVLERLQTQLAVSFADHCRFSRQLDILEAHQLDLESVLVSLEDDLKRAHSPFITTSDEREQLYSFSEHPQNYRVWCAVESRDISTLTLKQQDNTHVSSLGPMFHILQLHLRELQRIERGLHVLSKKI